jgi:conjugative transposon TraM protein
MKPISQKMRRQRKFLLVMPLLIIPFLTMAFWALGGGKNSGVSDTANPAGLNLELPGASLKDDKALDKLGYYDRAASDSLKLQEQMKSDPYFSKNVTAADSVLEALTGNIPETVNSGNVKSYNDPNEAKVYEKLGQLNTAMKDAAGGGNPTKSYSRNTSSDYASQTADIEKLEQMMAAGANVQVSNSPDPEMKQLNGMLEKILDIQHPDRLKAGQKNSVTAPEPMAICAVNSSVTFSSFDTSKSRTTSGFFRLPEKAADVYANAIEAVVHQSQTLVTGSVVKMRLLTDITVDGHCIPKDHFIYGIASLNKERLEISVHSIRDGESLFPVKLEVFDMDGLAGIYIPGAIGRDVAKQSGDNGLQSVSIGTIDPSLGAQAASAGIETAKNLLSRKVKLIKVQVKAGYKILLKNNSN